MTKSINKAKNDMKAWRAQCRRQLKRSLKDRMDYGFVYTYKPVMNDAPSHVFYTMEEYRKWCSDNLPEYLGYKIIENKKPKSRRKS